MKVSPVVNKTSERTHLRVDSTPVEWLVSKENVDGKCPSNYQVLTTIANHLLKFGGNKVCIQFVEPLNILSLVIEKGYLMKGDDVKLNPGKDNQCHNNVLDLCMQNPQLYRKVVGFSLSSDGIWRVHSWALDMNECIIETTATRELYYGAVLEGDIGHEYLKFIVGRASARV